MANYKELREIFNDKELNFRVDTAMAIGIDTLLTSNNADNDDRVWADHATKNPDTVSRQILQILFERNKNLSTVVMRSATDVYLQTKVDKIIPQLVDVFFSRAEKKGRGNIQLDEVI